MYQIELPDDWNGRLVLYMHGFAEFAPETNAAPMDFRRYLIEHGYAWGASSFSSTSLIPGRSADETAALWDYFARIHGRPERSYVNGLSMGGAASNIVAERYADRFDGALGLCGAAGQTEALTISVDVFVAGAYAAGVNQAEFDARLDVGALISDRIRPALDDPQARKQFENIVLDLTGGPRRFGREGFRAEEEINWRRVALAIAAGLALNRESYDLGPLSDVTDEEFNRDVIRLPVSEDLLAGFTEGAETTGNIQMPLLTLHSTGDGQVPIEQAQIYRRRVDDAGQGDLLVQRVIRDPGHCGFTTTEQEAGFEALVAWVEHGEKPEGTDVLIDDLRELDGTFELYPREGTPEAEAVPGVDDRVVVRGNATLDGAPFDARFLGARVERDGLITPCPGLAPVTDGRYEIAVMADAESSGCGAKGAQIILWTFVEGEELYVTDALRWPGNGETTTFDASFSTAAPDGAASPTVGFVGEVYDRRGRHLPPGTRVEAFVGDTRCGVASVRRTGSFSGFSLGVVGPGSVAGCEAGATLTFRIDGKPAAETAVNEPGGERSLDLSPR
ncbi:MAG: hypothetical protein H0V95_10945 [Actinobacteria bacterium]|nr:hypothetical protein [Actinomycetota bacterium]